MVLTKKVKTSSFLFLAFLLIPVWTACPGMPGGGKETPLDTAIAQLEELINEEIEKGHFTGLSIAIIDNQETVLARGYGYAKKEDGIEASSWTVYRVGSITKLFTAVGIMQLEEQGLLSLDEPVLTYYPEFSIGVPFENAGQITLRQLLAHRSGLPRESPVGSYFDDSSPSMAATVASLADAELVYPPGSKTKYSDAGFALAGAILARVSGQPYFVYQSENLIRRIRMLSTGFFLGRELGDRFATSRMLVTDGETYEQVQAPHFELGALAAGNLYSTVDDLARFLKMLLAGGRVETHVIIRKNTFQRMLEPQFSGDRARFGLGFSLGEFQGHKTIGHSGGVYGFTSVLTAIPGAGIGVVILANEDMIPGYINRIRDKALSLMLKVKRGERLPRRAEFPTPDPETFRKFAGEYESDFFWAEVKAQQEGLRLNISGQRMVLSPVGETSFLAGGRLIYDSPVNFIIEENGVVSGFNALGMTFTRVSADSALEVPEHWKNFVGKYGSSYLPLAVDIRHGHLYAMVENTYSYRLTPVSDTLFEMPPGLYEGERLEFKLDEDGNVRSVILGNVTLPPVE